MYTCTSICIKYGGITLRNLLMGLWELASSKAVGKLEMQEFIIAKLNSFLSGKPLCFMNLMTGLINRPSGD